MTETGHDKNHFGFNVSHRSSDGTLLEGLFIIKKQLTIREKMQWEVKTAEMCGSTGVDLICPHCEKAARVSSLPDSSLLLAKAMAHLDLCVVKAPEWWNMDELTDSDVLWVVYDHILKAEQNFFRKGGKGAPGTDGSGVGGAVAGEGEHKEPETTGLVTPVVGKEIPASLDLG